MICSVNCTFEWIPSEFCEIQNVGIKFNVLTLLSAMPQPPQLGVLPDADTASLMSSCGGNLDQTLPEMCLAVSPSRRKAVQAKMAAESAAFFLKYLGTPNPPPLPPEPEDNPQITSHPATPEKNAARKKKR